MRFVDDLRNLLFALKLKHSTKFGSTLKKLFIETEITSTKLLRQDLKQFTWRAWSCCLTTMAQICLCTATSAKPTKKSGLFSVVSIYEEQRETPCQFSTRYIDSTGTGQMQCKESRWENEVSVAGPHKMLAIAKIFLHHQLHFQF